MANPDHLAKLKEGVEQWNLWRRNHSSLLIDLSGANLGHGELSFAELDNVDLSKADLRYAKLYKTALSAANLDSANLTGAKLREACLERASLRHTTFFGAALSDANLRDATLYRANLALATLNRVNLQYADLREATVTGASLHQANLGMADLSRADFTETDFREADLQNADLSEATLRGADLSMANLTGAILTNTNFRQATLQSADLSGVNPYGANFRMDPFMESFAPFMESVAHANLIGTDFSEADLSGANLSGANLDGADLSLADLSKTNLTRADLSSARLQSATLDQAIANDIRLWETQRAGWSIKDITCERAYWYETSESTTYVPGEFERLYSKQPLVELFYKDGLTQFELNTLPALLKHLATLHPKSSIRIKSVQETGGGSKVSISVENIDSEKFEELSTEARLSQAAQLSLRNNPEARWEIEKRLLLDEVFPRMLASTSQNINVAGSATGLIIASGHASVNAHTNKNDLSAIRSLLNEVMRRKDDLGLKNDQEVQFDTAVRTVEDELHKSMPQASVVSESLKIVRDLAVKVVASAAEKTDWSLMLDQITYWIHKV